jgi:putative CocE/NonD family hydrolase
VFKRLAAVAIAGMLASPAADAHATEEHGYFATRDGTQLRYDVVHPDGPGPFPVLLNYEGYAAGSDPNDNNGSTFVPALLARGYAVLGVSVRGTGCSEGVFDPFAPTMGQDGADAVEWAARQPWSDGRVGMFGSSFGGITQLLTAAQRPPHLRAIAPDSATSDLYRDVAYPGGILNDVFPLAWTGIQKKNGATYALTGAVTAGDTKCDVDFAEHEVGNASEENLVPTFVVNHPYYDDAGIWIERAPRAGFKNIDVPAYVTNQWQDEQLPARIYESLPEFGRPKLVWADFSNGNHGRILESASHRQLTLDFLDRFVRNVPNGFARRVPHLSLDMETASADNEPAWTIARNHLSPRVQPRAFYLGSRGRLTAHRPDRTEGSDTYEYPRPSPDVLELGHTAPGVPAGRLSWKVPVPPGGSVAYTTSPMRRDVVLAGPASLDVWLSSTNTDTDLQATLTEVRPDGQEMYIQRGWLRASQRKLDRSRSTTLRPYQSHLRRDVTPLTVGKPTKLRLEIFPFAQALRKGSRLRVWIEAPTGLTGVWGFLPVAAVGTNTVYHDVHHPSTLVVGVLPGETAHAPMPPCDSLRNQPCRPDP